MSRFEVYDLVE